MINEDKYSSDLNLSLDKELNLDDTYNDNKTDAINKPKESGNIESSANSSSSSNPNKADLVLAEKLISEINYVKAELKLVIKDLNNTTKSVADDLSQNVKTLPEQLRKVDEAAFIMHKVPGKIRQNLEEATSAISKNVNEELRRDMLEEFGQSWKLCNLKIDELNSKIESMKQNVVTFQNGRLQKKILTFIGFMLMSAVMAVSATYFTIQKFPQHSHVHVTTEGGLNVKESEVSIYTNDGKLTKKIELNKK